ncbi:glucose-1-phosphate adenylyltransferase subunit GlgD [Selenomonas sp. F0473]|uniref:glucose-1-phosphate adenylyltransferase subunit GlgD n=1 Tax=Selenomonas sp. F0473 TaxID=999423 RepID=UPI00029E6F6B|nr:glucose-1-phosphate adenylyltransferase subunit GlgD [Selenomonas sp. F0473]EKU70587.1 glucose-1-phosphate adenylyltransferase, GlgD subunit [Selenomonas sp. F0473]
MNSVMGLINLQEDGGMIRELAERRAVGSIPFAGRYRLIDFALSSMVNSGINKVGVMLPDEPRSVLDHLRSGKDWDLARRHDGLFYLPAPHEDTMRRGGDLKNFYHNLDFIEHASSRYILLTNGSFVYNVDFEKALRFHQNTGADITLVSHTTAEENAGNNIVLETAETGLVRDISEKPVAAPGMKVSMGVCLMDRHVFADAVRYAYERGGRDFMLDGIIRRAADYTMFAYEHDGYMAHVDSMSTYYRANMEILDPAVWESLFMSERPVYTKIKDGVPVQYKDTAKVSNSLIANGCVVRGEVEHSILFRGVKVGRDVKIKNSIIMQKCDIGDGALVENVICDKNVVITPEKWLKGAREYPLVIKKNITI